MRTARLRLRVTRGQQVEAILPRQATREKPIGHLGQFKERAARHHQPGAWTAIVASARALGSLRAGTGYSRENMTLVADKLRESARRRRAWRALALASRIQSSLGRIEADEPMDAPASPDRVAVDWARANAGRGHGGVPQGLAAGVKLG